MACDKCKKKNELKTEMMKTEGLVDKKIIAFVIIWTSLGFYGLFQLISKFI